MQPRRGRPHKERIANHLSLANQSCEASTRAHFAISKIPRMDASKHNVAELHSVPSERNVPSPSFVKVTRSAPCPPRCNVELTTRCCLNEKGTFISQRPRPLHAISEPTLHHGGAGGARWLIRMEGTFFSLGTDPKCMFWNPAICSGALHARGGPSETLRVIDSRVTCSLAF